MELDHLLAQPAGLLHRQRIALVIQHIGVQPLGQAPREQAVACE